MKRTNLVLDEYIRRHTFAQIDTFAGTDVWEGDLSVMREDTGDRDFPLLARVSPLRERQM